MEIDPHHLPAEVNLLQQIVLQLLQAVEDKDQLVARLQHQLAQLLRYRYGQKRERIGREPVIPVCCATHCRQSTDDLYAFRGRASRKFSLWL